MIKKEQGMIENLVMMLDAHLQMVEDNMFDEPAVSKCHTREAQAVCTVLLDYVQHFTDNIGLELKDLSAELINNYDDNRVIEIGQKLNCLANGTAYIG